MTVMRNRDRADLRCMRCIEQIVYSCIIVLNTILTETCGYRGGEGAAERVAGRNI